MDALIAALSEPAAYPFPVADIEVVQTHISVVFLAGDWVYKVKKSVDFGFVDYSTLSRRKRFCEAEVELNRRYAGDVYVGVVPIDVEHRFEGAGQVLEWAVKMRRLPEGATVRAQIEVLDAADLARVGRRLAQVHAAAESAPSAIRAGAAVGVADNAKDNFTQTAGHVGGMVSPEVYGRLQDLTEQALERLGPVIESRALMTRDTHGDLRAEHVYLWPDRVLFLDCIEFSDAFRWADPVSDLAFLYMDLAIRGRRDLAEALANAWFGATGDDEGRQLLPFYVAYRSLVRAKVRGLHGDVASARRHWLFALGELDPAAGPRLVGIGGLPGTGKSTVALGLAARTAATVLRSDVVRKELAGLAPTDRAGQDGYESGIYTPEWKERVYAECLARAEQAVFAGRVAVVDASFSREQWRTALLDLGRSLGVPTYLLWCELTPAVAQERLASRVDDASDADVDVYRSLAPQWQAESARTLAHLTRIDTSGTREQAIAVAVKAVGATLGV